MNKLVIEKHNFEKAKNQLKEFSLTKPEELALKKVEVDGGLFNWFDHKVTGQELNDLTKRIQGYLVKFNTLNKKFIKEFGEVYNALEALDKEYIQGILLSIKSAEQASREAKNAQKDIHNTIEIQKQTIGALKNFKEKLDKYEYLENVDEVWKDTQRFGKNLESINAEIDNIKLTFEGQFNSILQLDTFKEELSKFKYLSNIDVLWEEVQVFNMDINSIKGKINEIKKNFNEQGNEVEALNQFVGTISQYKHLNDIDQVWEDSQTFFKNIDSINEQIDGIKKKIKEQENEVEALNQFVGTISQYKHLNDIDQVWEDSQTSFKNIDSINKQIVGIKKKSKEQESEVEALNQFVGTISQYKHLNDIDQVWEDGKKNKSDTELLKINADELEQQLFEIKQQWDEDKVKYESQIITAFKKTKIAYALAGGSIVIAILQFILNLVGIL
ncbi:hypothetical protein [Alkalicoccobacillus porphyridii]|uniref:Uncharacterized protein n=1 Tax=Alkalicoccobacillus porphyridii TaxID=2597270 RepID=A0A553ZV27_9BACI|nr:hypothetical protein [Alkalicoccobacillus porphyridii]TSB45340.1 hypothetical protein FN960_16705 [Alkalicoccobacillus porphyridii]